MKWLPNLRARERLRDTSSADAFFLIKVCTTLGTNIPLVSYDERFVTSWERILAVKRLAMPFYRYRSYLDREGLLLNEFEPWAGLCEKKLRLKMS